MQYVKCNTIKDKINFAYLFLVIKLNAIKVTKKKKKFKYFNINKYLSL